MSKTTVYSLFLAVVTLCSCHKEDEPLRVRYQNLSGLHLRSIRVDIHNGDSFQLNDLGPGDCSEYQYLDELTTFAMMPGQNMFGLTDNGRFQAISFLDCLTGIEIKNHTSGSFTILIMPSVYGEASTLGDAAQLSLVMKHEWVERLKTRGIKFSPF